VARIGFVLLAVIADRIDELNGYRGWLEDGETVDLPPPRVDPGCTDVRLDGGSTFPR